MATSGSHGLESEITPVHILIAYSPRVQALAARLCNLVRETVPDAVERAYPVWRGIGYRHPVSGYYCGIFPQENWGRLVFEYGALLADPDDLSEREWETDPLCADKEAKRHTSALVQAAHQVGGRVQAQLSVTCRAQQSTL